MAAIDKIRCTEETDFVVLNYDQSDIEEIDESLDNSEADTSTNNQPKDDNAPSSSNQKDNSHAHSEEDDEENDDEEEEEEEEEEDEDEEEDDDDETNQVETSEITVSQRLERRKIHGSQSEGLLNTSDTEPFGSSSVNCDQETCKLLSNKDYCCSDENGEELDDDEEGMVDVVYLEDEYGLELEELDPETIRQRRKEELERLKDLLWKLTAFVAIFMSIALGYFLAWYSHYSTTQELVLLNNNHSSKLKILQDELVSCMDKLDMENVRYNEVVAKEKERFLENMNEEKESFVQVEIEKERGKKERKERRKKKEREEREKKEKQKEIEREKRRGGKRRGREEERGKERDRKGYEKKGDE